MLTIFSDLHLTDESTSTNVHSDAFLILRDEICARLRDNQTTELEIVLLGDIFDLVRSDWWFWNNVALQDRPWSNISVDTAMNPDPRIEGQFGQILEGILGSESGKTLLSALNDAGQAAKASFQIPRPRITYVVGNHDRAVNNFASLRTRIAGSLPAFEVTFEPLACWRPDYAVEARHGHEWDHNCNGAELLNSVLKPGSAYWPLYDVEVARVMSIGEVVTAELMGGLVYRIACQNPTLAASLRDINNLRPMTDVFHYLDWLLPSLGSTDKSIVYQALVESLDGVVECDLAKSWVRIGGLDNLVSLLKDARAALKLAGGFNTLKTIVNLFKGLLPSPGPNSKDADSEGAVKELCSDQSTKPWRQYVVYGHTHEARNDSLSGTRDGQVQMYVNTGTYLPLIQEAEDRESFVQAQQMTLLFFYRQGEDGDAKTGNLPTMELWNGIKRKQYASRLGGLPQGARKGVLAAESVAALAAPQLAGLPPLPQPSEHLEKLIGAFNADGYEVNQETDKVEKDGFIGLRAMHRTATIGSSDRRKKAFYVEGDHYTMGYLMGLLAEPEIARMTTDFNRDIVFDFIGLDFKPLEDVLGQLLEDILNVVSSGMRHDVPQTFQAELEGMLDGCRKANNGTAVTREGLWVLNVGIDALLAFVYTGRLPLLYTGLVPIQKRVPFELKPEHFRVPFACNGFAASGKDETGTPYHFLGRDFMFATAHVFQDTAALIIRNPKAGNGLATVSVAAPGMAGTIAGVNSAGVGVGVDISPAANCDPNRPGLNSLLLTRQSIEQGRTCQEALEVMATARRGVSWLYILADGATDDACILEAGASTPELDFLQYTDQWAIDTLNGALRAANPQSPDLAALLKKPSSPVLNGLVVRRIDYVCPSAYQDLNPSLIDAYRTRVPSYKYKYNPADFAPDGRLCANWKDNKCPGLYYFPPQRQPLKGTILVTNHGLIPEMRLCAMNWWTAMVAGGRVNDIQWRYDALHRRLLGSSLQKGGISYDQAKNEAKAAIDFLTPSGEFKDYYNPKSAPLSEVEIGGAVCLIDLKAATIESHYGYQADAWVQLGLRKYLQGN